MKYEEIGTNYYSMQDFDKRNLTHHSNADLQDKMGKIDKKTKNPYRVSYQWMKGEHMDAQGLLDALNGKRDCDKLQF